MRNRTFLIVLLFIFFLCLLSFFHLEIWVYPIGTDPALPAGNIIAWILLSFPSLIAWLAFKKHFDIIPLYFMVLIYMGLITGLPWGFVSRAVSGNWMFEYVNIPDASKRMTYYTYFTGAVQLFVLVASPLLFLWIKKKRG